MAEISTNTKYGLILVTIATLLIIITDVRYFHGASLTAARFAFNVGVIISMIIIYYGIIMSGKRTSHQKQKKN
jgi:hypothetical protein